MQISRLIDDYNDECLRDYWKNNISHLLSSPIKKTVAHSRILFHPCSQLVVHELDFKNVCLHNLMSAENLFNTISFSKKSNEEIYELINYELNMVLTEIVTMHGQNHPIVQNRLKLYPHNMINKIEMDNGLSRNHSLLPIINLFKLRYPHKNLLFLSLLTHYFGYDMNNSDLIEYTMKDMERFVKENEIFF